MPRWFRFRKNKTKQKIRSKPRNQVRSSKVRLGIMRMMMNNT